MSVKMFFFNSIIYIFNLNYNFASVATSQAFIIKVPTVLNQTLK